MQTPIGVIAIIYESRPNVTVDASALSFKSGNPCILRCGADSINSCNEIFRSIEESIVDIGLPKSCIQFINNSDRQLVKEILSLSEYIDVVIPRGGKDLVKKVLNWNFKIKLKDGLKNTYNWISSEMKKKGSNLSRFTKS